MFLRIFDISLSRRFRCPGKGPGARVIVTQRAACLLFKCCKQGRAKVVKHLMPPSSASSSSCFIHFLKTGVGHLLPTPGMVHSHD